MSYPTSRKVVIIDSKESIENAINILLNNGVISAPVLDKEQNRFIGWADLADFLAVIRGIEFLRGVIPKSKIRNQYLNIHGINVDLSRSARGDALDLPVSALLTVDQQTAPWHPVKSTESVREVVKALGTKVEPPWSPCRRVPIVDVENGDLLKIYSQSEVVNQIYHGMIAPGHTAQEPLFAVTARTSRIGTEKVISVKLTDPVAKAFDLMVAHCISAVAVVNDEEKLETVVSNKDIGWLLRMRKMYLEAGSIGEDPIKLSVIDFISNARMLAIGLNSKRSEAVVVSADTLIEHVIAKLAECKTHRVWIVDEKHKPIGIISVSDIVTALLNENLPWPLDIVEKHIL